jgi:predicted  nucleic acid-binding Zn-ribbon protein
MSSLDQLLVLQGHDTTLEQLEHRRVTLHERDRLVALRGELATTDARLTETGAMRDEVARIQKRLEDEVASVEAKVVDVHAKLYGGGITSPRELQALQDDENSLKRHQSTLEDKVLEQMELAVPLDQELADLRTSRAEVESQIVVTEGQITVAEAEIDVRLDEVGGERRSLAAALDPALVQQYEQLRHDLGGIAVAPLAGNNCGGCHLTLSAVELDRVRHEPEGTLVFCGECGRLLVR